MNLIQKIKNNPQLIRFGLVGGVNTALDFGLLFMFKAFGLPIGLANIVSTSIAFVFSFFANKKYTFKKPAQMLCVKCYFCRGNAVWTVGTTNTSY